MGREPFALLSLSSTITRVLPNPTWSRSLHMDRKVCCGLSVYLILSFLVIFSLHNFLSFNTLSLSCLHVFLSLSPSLSHSLIPSSVIFTCPSPLLPPYSPQLNLTLGQHHNTSPATLPTQSWGGDGVEEYFG